MTARHKTYRSLSAHQRALHHAAFTVNSDDPDHHRLGSLSYRADGKQQTMNVPQGDIFHQFSPHGVTGVLAIAESHISVHTWPEKGFAAFDVFMCGNAEPRKALDVFKRVFEPGRVVVGEHKRGVV